MTLRAKHNTIRSRFKTEVADARSLSTVYDNSRPSFLSDVTQPHDWARFTILHSEASQKEIGENMTFRYAGIAVTQLFTVIDKGDNDLLLNADTVVTAFRGVQVSGVRFGIPYATTVGRTPDGKWWQVNINCPFTFDE